MKHDRTQRLEILSANYVMIRKHGTGFAVHDSTPNQFKFIGFYQRYGNAINGGERHLAKKQRNKDTNHVCQKCHKESRSKSKGNT